MLECMIGRPKHPPSPFAKLRGIFRVAVLGVGFTKKHRVFPLLPHHLLFADPDVYVGEDRSLDDPKPRTFFCGEYRGVHGHRYDDLIATKHFEQKINLADRGD